MSKYSGIVDADPDTGLTTWFHREHDGSWVYQKTQDVEPILEANRWNQSFNHMNGGLRRVASIPLIIIEKWLREYGVNYWDPDHQDKVDQLLNSSDWKWLRTDESTL